MLRKMHWNRDAWWHFSRWLEKDWMKMPTYPGLMQPILDSCSIKYSITTPTMNSSWWYSTMQTVINNHESMVDDSKLIYPWDVRGTINRFGHAWHLLCQIFAFLVSSLRITDPLSTASSRICFIVIEGEAVFHDWRRSLKMSIDSRWWDIERATQGRALEHWATESPDALIYIQAELHDQVWTLCVRKPLEPYWPSRWTSDWFVVARFGLKSMTCLCVQSCDVPCSFAPQVNLAVRKLRQSHSIMTDHTEWKNATQSHVSWKTYWLRRYSRHFDTRPICLEWPHIEL